MRSLSRLSSLACLWLAGAGLCAMTLIILWQVFARYVLNASPAWSLELALYLLIWTAMLAAAAGVREQFHIRITLLEDNLNAGPRRLVLLLSHGITGALGVFLTVAGIEIVAGTWLFDIPALPMPRGSAFIPIPVAGALIALYSLEHIIALAQNTEVEPTWKL